MSKILIRDGAVLTGEQGYKEILTPGYVYVQGETIAAVGAGEPPERFLNECDELISAKGFLVIPGLINAHTHLFQTFLRGLADDKPLLEWLACAIWPGALAMTEEDIYLSALIGFAENLKCGATSVLSQDYVQVSKRNMDRVADAAHEIGVRALLARGYAERDPYNPRFQESADVVIQETERLVKTWNQREDGRIRVEFGPLIPWGCHAETLRKANELAKEWDVGIHIHVSETQPEVQMSLDEYGVPPVRWLHELGVLNERWQLVHCVWVSEEEMDLIASSGATIVHNPISNMYLASGIPKVVEWRKRNIPVALATDGPGSNNSQDLLEVLKFTACLQKVATLDATVLSPEQVVEMVYQGGARAMRLSDKIGRLAPGAYADLVLVNLQRPHISPVHSPVSALVYNANGNDVDTVIVGGKIVVRQGRLLTVNEERLIADCQRAAERMAERAGFRSWRSQNWF
ncbi:MAG: amidohydrolase [Anaerolineales bacterium]|nr:amidohydrolase [Anaerolineales bacterium]MCS7248151.1 amidohydrolase [Anaerolineales bacterium]MDW8161963.1 amidohydrolase [Anaerolineales bacterium]MDW8447174.1 amidohydrolase [Anaerolineales bacterium]